jgi:hypothetical protein
MLTECLQPTQNCKTSTSIALFHRKQWNYLILVRKFCIRQLYSRLKKKYSNSYQKYIEPEAEGTLISNQQMDFTNPVKGISHIDKISLITLEGSGMIGGWFFQRLFCVCHKKMSMSFYYQASSEHSICIGILNSDADISNCYKQSL